MLKLKVKKAYLIVMYLIAIIFLCLGIYDRSCLIVGVIALAFGLYLTFQNGGVFDKNGYTDKNGDAISWDEIHAIKILGNGTRACAEIEYGDGQTKIVHFADIMGAKKFVTKVNEIAGREVAKR